MRNSFLKFAGRKNGREQRKIIRENPDLIYEVAIKRINNKQGNEYH